MKAERNETRDKYLIATHIPIFTDGFRHFTDISWQRDLILTRDWLARPYGGLKLIAPSLPLQSASNQGMALAPIGVDDDICVVPSFDLRCRARRFWLRERHVWNRDVLRELATARVFHTSACDVYRPLTFMAHSAARRAGIPTVFVGPDMDLHVTLPPTIRGKLQCLVFEQWMRSAIGQASLTLLKEGLVHERYARFGANVHPFCHSMHSQADVISDEQLERRLQALKSHLPLKAVYAGRFVRRKGLHDAVAVVARAHASGVPLELHLFGGGPEEGALREQAKALGVHSSVIFHGVVEYSPAFIRTLAEFDVFLFMPIEEDTPRAIFDSMAAGLPLVGTRIPFLNTRVSGDRQGVLVGVGDSDAAADMLGRLHRDPENLSVLSRNARLAGIRHSIEQWYQQRADWTQEVCTAER